MPTCPRSSDQGFTLIELMVVLAILSVLVVIAAPTIGRRPAGVLRHEAQAKLGAAIAASREQALRAGARQVLDVRTIVPDVILQPALPSEPDPLLIFYPDGSSNGGTVLLDGKPVVEITWLTGGVRDAR